MEINIISNRSILPPKSSHTHSQKSLSLWNERLLKYCSVLVKVCCCLFICLSVVVVFVLFLLLLFVVVVVVVFLGGGLNTQLGGRMCLILPFTLSGISGLSFYSPLLSA